MLAKPTALLTAALAAPSIALAQTTVTVTINPSRDNAIWDVGTLDCCSNGAGTRMFAGRTGQNIAIRALTRFDVASVIPPGAAILVAELDVECVQGNGVSNTVSIHRVSADWGEGPSFAASGQGGGAPSAGPDANWFFRIFDQGEQWQTPGGDFDPQVSAAQPIGGVGSYTFSSTPGLVADVQSWLAFPSQNFGWMLIGDGSLGPSTAKALATREDASNQPVLRVTYDTTRAYWLPFGDACDPFGPPPSLGLDPNVGNGQPSVNMSFRLQFTTTSSPLSSTTLFLATGAQLPPLTLPATLSCSIALQSIVHTEPTDANLGLTLFVPNTPAIAGADLYWQGFAITGFVPTLVATNAVLTHFGS